MVHSIKRMRLGEQLVHAGLLTEEEVNEALSAAKNAGLKLGEYLVRKGVVSEQKVLEVVAAQTNLSLYSQERFPIDPGIGKMVEVDVVQKERVLPLCMRDGVLYVAMLDVMNTDIIDNIALDTGLEVEPVLCLQQEFVGLFKSVYGDYSAVNQMLDEIKPETTPEQVADVAVVENKDEVIDTGTPDGAPVIRLVNLILAEGVRMGASDVHINPEKNMINVRYRVDGLLRKGPVVPSNMGPSIASRIKILGNMDISKTRVPQDGRFTVIIDKREINVRVSTLPTTYGENTVLRMLDMSSNRVYTLSKLGMSDTNRIRVERSARKPYGMILSTGPTGSGKSSSLYSIIQMVNREDVNIVTLEDPVEYRMPGVRQVQLNVKAGLDFASGLRSILRQDPDIVMVGEIRDSETARIAVQAALTGHLVLSTLHTNDAIGAINRLVDMGVEPYLVASVLLCTFGQRLVRTICPHCRVPYEPDPQLLRRYGLPEHGRYMHGAGCARCGQTGFIGRTGVFEVLEVVDRIQEEVIGGCSQARLHQVAQEEGFSTMAQDAVAKVLNGVTTIEEVARVTMV